ncbi:MAG: hypothetical protein AAF710_01030 [Planctomycetota bacterium]
MNDQSGSVDRADPGRWWCDTHVHLHPRFEAGAWLDAASANLAAAGARPGGGVLCLAEGAGVHAFRGLRERGAAGAWRFEAWGEHGLRAEREGCDAVGVIAGRQVRCGDGLEVLGLGRDFELGDGGGLEETVDAVRAAGALAVVPFGVGKWRGARGRAVRNLIDRGPADLALADNAGRVGFGEPALLARARAAGRTVLAGSDPLDLEGAERHAGRWGVVVDTPGGSAGCEAVLAALGAAGPNAATFGRRLPLVAAVTQQARLRL